MERMILSRDIKIRQHDRKDCAAACLASVCAYYGLKLPFIKFRDECGTNEDGATLQGIIDAGRKFGLEAAGFRSPDRRLSNLINGKKPLILHLEKKNGWLHFVVLYDLDDRIATIMDPETGDIQKSELKDIENEWSGYVVALTPSSTFSSGDFRTNVFKRYRDIFTCYKKELCTVLLASVIVIAATLSTSVFLQKIIDDVLPSSDIHTLITITLIMAGLILLTWFISSLRSIILLRTSLKIDHHLIMSYFQKIFSLPVSFFDSRSTGELNARVSDAYRIRSFITNRLLIIAVSILTILISIAILGTFNWRLTTVLLGFIPIYAILYILSQKKFNKFNKDIIESNARFEEICIENLASARSIMYFGAEKDATERIEKAYKLSANALYKGGLFSSIIASSTDCISRITTLIVLIAGSFLVISFHISIGELASFFTIASLFTAPVDMLIDSTKEITEARISAERIFDIVDIESNTSSKNVPYATFDHDAAIYIRDLSFSFPGRKILLNKINCKIYPHKINLLRGSNGCGKSTLAAILMRGYKPDSGFIAIGDKDITEIPLEQWRKYICIIPQRPDIFNGTILDNIVMGDKNYTMDSVLAACILAGLGNTLKSVPGGVMAHTGEYACRLSGGEKQKISIARALYRRSKVLILDEADSHLDIESQKAIEKTILTLKEKGITIIMMSHNEKAALIADNIIDLEKPNAQTEA